MACKFCTKFVVHQLKQTQVLHHHKHCKLLTRCLWPLPREGPAASPFPFPFPGGWLLAKAAALTGWELPCTSIRCSASASLVSTVIRTAGAHAGFACLGLRWQVPHLEDVQLIDVLKVI